MSGISNPDTRIGFIAKRRATTQKQELKQELTILDVSSGLNEIYTRDKSQTPVSTTWLALHSIAYSSSKGSHLE